MALEKYTGATDIIQKLDDRPNDVGGLSADELKAKFDQFGAEFVEWFNNVHLPKVAEKETVDSHLAESASKHITESGENDNGRYIKFDDGTMICFFNTVITPERNPVEAIYNSELLTWTYPASFTNIPMIAATINSVGADDILRFLAGRSINETAWNFYIASINDRAQVSRYALIAIGRWK